MIDRILSKTGVGFALLFMVAELAYINTISLRYMFAGRSELDAAFGVIGAIAFSIVTVLVMRLGKRAWLKVVFPGFDIALVFCGFNLEHASDLLANPVRFAMSVFLSLFAGLITFSLGQINAEQHSGEATEKKLLQSENERLKSELLKSEGIAAALKSNYDKLTSDFKETSEKSRLLQSKIDEMAGNNSKMAAYNIDLKSKLDDITHFAEELESKLSQTAAELNKYKPAALAADIARIRKKKPENRTEEEIRILEEAA